MLVCAYVVLPMFSSPFTPTHLLPLMTRLIFTHTIGKVILFNLRIIAHFVFALLSLVKHLLKAYFTLFGANEVQKPPLITLRSPYSYSFSFILRWAKNARMYSWAIELFRVTFVTKKSGLPLRKKKREREIECVWENVCCICSCSHSLFHWRSRTHTHTQKVGSAHELSKLVSFSISIFLIVSAASTVLLRNEATRRLSFKLHE